MRGKGRIEYESLKRLRKTISGGKRLKYVTLSAESVKLGQQMMTLANLSERYSIQKVDDGQSGGGVKYILSMKGKKGGIPLTAFWGELLTFLISLLGVKPTVNLTVVKGNNNVVGTGGGDPPTNLTIVFNVTINKS